MLPQQVQQLLKAIFVCVILLALLLKIFIIQNEKGFAAKWKKKNTKGSEPLVKTMPLCSAAQLLGLDCSWQMLF